MAPIRTTQTNTTNRKSSFRARRLIVNADDFGLTEGINRAIVELHGSGGLDSTTLMATGPRFHEAVDLARQHPALSIGCHIVLVDGTPAADPHSIPSLLEHSRNGQPHFRRSLAKFARDLFLGRIARAEIEREVRAQILRLQEEGIRVTHVDTHKHTHMFPPVMDAVTRAAVACGIHAIRNPFELAWSLTATPSASILRRSQVRLLSRSHPSFIRTVRKAGLATTQGCLGVLATGTLDEITLRSILLSLPEGDWEMVCHPGYADPELRATPTRLQESRERERSALQALPDLLASLGTEVTRIHFGQL